MTEDNAMVWDRARRGLYEVWYLTGSHLPSDTGFWIRTTMEAPQLGIGEPYCEVWFAFFDRHDAGKTFAMHQRFPISELTAERGPFRVRVGEHAEVRSDGARGRLTCGSHSAEWDLSWLPAQDTYRHLPEAIYRTDRVDTKVCSPNLNVAMRGHLVVDGRRLELEGDPGDQTHVWGKKHAYSWVWSHCNAFEGNRSAAWESLSVKLKRGGFVLPTLSLLTLELDGEPLRFNQFQHLPLTSGRWADGHYVARARGLDVKLEAEFRGRFQDFIATPYLDPDGEGLWCMNSCIADATVTVWRRSRFGLRWKEAARLEAPGRAHWEYGQRERDPRVTHTHEAF